MRQQQADTAGPNGVQCRPTMRSHRAILIVLCTSESYWAPRRAFCYFRCPVSRLSLKFSRLLHSTDVNQKHMPPAVHWHTRAHSGPTASPSQCRQRRAGVDRPGALASPRIPRYRFSAPPSPSGQCPSLHLPVASPSPSRTARATDELGRPVGRAACAPRAAALAVPLGHNFRMRRGVRHPGKARRGDRRTAACRGRLPFPFPWWRRSVSHRGGPRSRWRRCFTRQAVSCVPDLLWFASLFPPPPCGLRSARRHHLKKRPRHGAQRLTVLATSSRLALLPSLKFERPDDVGWCGALGTVPRVGSHIYRVRRGRSGCSTMHAPPAS